MRRGVAGALLAATMCAPATSGAPAGAAARPARATAGGGDTVIAGAGSGIAVLGNGEVRRTWSVGGHGYATTELRDMATDRAWVAAPSPDFHIDLDGVTMSSAGGWSAVSVTASQLTGGDGRVVFDLRSPSGVEVRRSATLHAGSAVIETATTLVDALPLPHRVGSWSLDEVTSTGLPLVEVQAYRGGSDFQDSFRSVRSESGAFDDEGEVARLDSGGGDGVFLVSERRGAVASRIVRTAAGTAWRTSAAVDPARDLLDTGPITAPGTTDNRVDNPLYPLPLRQRTLLPLGILTLGTVFTGTYHGGATAAPAVFAADFDSRNLPGLPRSVDQNTFHPFGHGAQMSDAALRPQAAAALALGVETFMLDDQWQGSSAGDWSFDPARFPDTDNSGTPDFVDYIHGLGLNLGLWMSPAEFNAGSAAYKSHPQWACTPTGQVTARLKDDSGLGVWDLTNPGLRAHLTAAVDHAVAAWGVTEFKFDFMSWVDCPPHDYLDYEDAFVSLVRSFEQRHPTVTFELDETNDQRSWPFESASLGPSWFDNDHTHGSTVVAKQLHDLWSAAPWLPPSSLGLGLYDGTLRAPYSAAYLMSIAVLSHITLWTDTAALSPGDAAETAWWLGWYRVHRGELSGMVYEDSASDPLDGSSWLALQPWSGDRGYLFVFGQGGGASTQAIALRGLDPARGYALTEVRTGASLGTFPGSTLAAGLPVSLSLPFSSEVIAVTPA